LTQGKHLALAQPASLARLQSAQVKVAHTHADQTLDLIAQGAEHEADLPLAPLAQGYAQPTVSLGHGLAPPAPTRPKWGSARLQALDLGAHEGHAILQVHALT